MVSQFQTGQQAVTNAAVALNGGTRTAFSGGIVLKNLTASTTSLFYGITGVTTNTGCELPPGAADTLPISDISSVYIIAASNSTATVSWVGIL